MEDWLCDRRALYAALLADPGASYCGSWRIQPASVAVDAGLSRQKVEALLPKMEPLVFWCPERRIVFLPTFAEEQTAPKGCKIAGFRDHQRLTVENPEGPFVKLASTWAQVAVKLTSTCRQVADDDADDGKDRSVGSAGSEGVQGEPLALAPPELKPKRQRKAKPVSEGAPKPHVYPEGFALVWDCWLKQRNKPQETPILACDVINFNLRIKEGYAPAHLRWAMFGVAEDPWVAERDSFSFILRTGEQVQRLFPLGKARLEEEAAEEAKHAPSPEQLEVKRIRDLAAQIMKGELAIGGAP